MIDRICKFFLISCVWFLPVNAQTRERVYVQTDKQLYMSGELLWLKMYTTDTDGKLQSLSKIGYVELIRDSIPEVQIKLDIPDGTGVGWMELPVMLPTGYYRMIAYTRYMRNEGENVFFEKTIAIVNPFHQNEALYSDDTKTSFAFRPIENSRPAFDLSIDKTSYTIRDNGTIRIDNLPAENISLGISIAGIDPILAANPTIDTWKGQLATKNTPVGTIQYLPEYEGAIIDGIVIDLETGNPVIDTQDAENQSVFDRAMQAFYGQGAEEGAINLLSFPGNEIQLFAGQLFTNGEITFYTQCVTGKHELATTAIAPSGKKYRIDMQSPFVRHTPVNVPLFNPDSAWLDYLELRNLSVQVTHAYLADSLSIIKEITPCTDLVPHRRYILDDWTRFSSMEELFIEFISMCRIRRTGEGRRFSMADETFLSSSDNILVLLDNIPVPDHELVINYNPLSVKTIDVHFGQYIFGNRVFDGIIAFYTYKNDYPGITFGESTQIYDYEGAQPYRYFYAPKYDAISVSSPLPDFRHTLLWEPDFQTKGQSTVVIPFSTSDIAGEYCIIVEGITSEGQPLRGVAHFQVGEAGESMFRKLRMENVELKIEENKEENQLLSYSVNQLINQVTDTVATKENAVTEEIITPQPVVQQSQQPIVKTAEATSQMNYYAIIGSFASETQANQFMKQINMPELTNMGIVISDGRFRVYAAKFDNRDEAQNYLVRLRANEKFKDAWLFVGQ